MIVAVDYEDLVFNCQDLLARDLTRILGELVDSINTNPSYAALTVMALYTAAINIDFPIDQLDVIIMLAEESCTDSKVLDYKRFFVKFKEFEKSKDKIHLSENHFFVPPSPNVH